MSAPVVLAVDQGSTATKAAAFALDGTVRARAERPVAVRREGSRAEHDPEELLRSVREALAEVAAADRPVAVALAAQRSTCLLWERQEGRALTPALSWQDLRAADEVARLAPHGAEIAARSGLRLSPHYAGPKLAWLLRDPELGRRATAGELVAGTLDAFLAQRLAGAPVTEPGHAGRTLLYGLDGDAWDPWLLALFAVPAAALPELAPSVAARGEILGAPFVVRLGDQQAALLAHTSGAEAGTVAVHFGTGAFTLAATGAAPRRWPGLLTAVLAAGPDGRWFQLESPVNAAGSAVDWAARLGGIDLAALPDDELDPERLPLLVPALGGLGGPWWDPAARGVLDNLGHATGGADLVRGALAGVALRIADGLREMRSAGVAATVRASGRLTRFGGLTALVAETAELPVEVVDEEEAGLLGAARRAAAAVAPGCALAERAPAVVRRHQPGWSAGRRERLQARWRQLLAVAHARP